MQTPNLEPLPEQHSAVLGILAGLGIGAASWLVTLVLVLFTQLPFGQGVLLLLPPVLVVSGGMIARRKKQPKFAAGFFIAAAVVVLLEASCARFMFA